MLWYTSIAAQRLMPRGEAAMACAERPGILTGSYQNHDLGRWRS